MKIIVINRLNNYVKYKIYIHILNIQTCVNYDKYNVQTTFAYNKFKAIKNYNILINIVNFPCNNVIFVNLLA